MGSGFLRDIALRRQLEEKVKEATKTRGLAEKEIAEARALIDGAKKADANVGEAETVLADAIAAMGTRDYREALEKSSEARERGKRAYADRARQLLDTTRSLVALTKGLRADDGDSETALDRAEDAFVREAFGDAVDLAQGAWKKSEKVLHEHLSSSFSAAQSLIMTAKGLEKDTGPTEDLLSRARSAVEANDFEMAIAFTEECLRTVREELQQDVDRDMRDVQDAMDVAGELGADVGNVDRLVERARADVSRGEYDKALNSLKQARVEVDKSLNKSLRSRRADFDKLVAEARAIGADVAHATTVFTSFDEAFREGKLAEAAKVARDGLGALRKAQFDRVLLTLGASREKFVTARNLGADLGPAIEHLNRARAALQAKRFREAVALAQKADEAVDGVVREHQDVSGEIRAMQRALADGQAGGADIGGASRELDRAKASLAQRDVRGAVEQLGKSREQFKRAQSERARQVIERAESVLTSGEKMGANLVKPSDALAEAATAVKGGDFVRGMELAIRSREQAEEAIQETINDAIVGLRSGTKFPAEDASSIRGLLDRAESKLAAREFEGAYGHLSEALRLAEAKTRDKALQVHELLRTAIQTGIELGCDVSSLEAGVKEAKGGVDRGTYAEAAGLGVKLARAVGVVADNAFNAVKAKVVDAKNLRIDISEMRERLKRAKVALSVEDYAGAFAVLRECNEKVSGTLDRHREVYNEIASAAAFAAEAKKREVNVNKVLEMLLDAKRALERFDHERALDLAHRAKEETKKLLAIYASAQRIVAARKLLDVVGRVGIDAPHLREMLDGAKTAMKDNDFEKAQQYAERGEREVRELIRERVTDMLGASETLLASLKGVAVLEQEEKLVRAREALAQGDLVRAAELANEVRGEIDAIKDKSAQAAAAVSGAQRLLEEIEGMNVEVSGGIETLRRTEQALEEDRFDDTLSLAAETVDQLEREREEKVAAMMARFEEAVHRAKRNKVDTRSAEKLLSRAKEFLKERKYRQALALAMQSEGEAEKVALQQEMASKAIATARKNLNGLGVAIPVLERMLDEARRSLGEGDYVRALDAAIKMGEEFGYLRKVSEEAIGIGKRGQALREVASAIGADVAGLDADFEKARTAIERGEPQAARDAYRRAFDSTLEAVRAAVEGKLSTVQELTEVGNRVAADVTAALRKWSEANALADEEDFEGAVRLADQGADAARQAIHRRVEDAIATTEAALDHARKLGADGRRAGELLEEARNGLGAGAFEKALELARESKTAIPLHVGSDKRFAEISLRAESAIRDVKKFGVDVREAERLLSEAIRTRKDDVEKALPLAEQAYAAAQRSIEAFSPNITPTLTVNRPVEGEWVEATLTLRNNARGLARDVRINILGDAEVKELKGVPAIKAQGTETLPLKVKMIASGSVPLAIQVVSTRVLDDEETRRETVATVEVAEPTVQRRTLQATKESRCPVCRGRIKVGFTVGRCPECGQEMHELCAGRAPACPACGHGLQRDGTQT